MTTEVTTFEKKLNWRDGVAFALIIPIAIFATVAPAIAAVGSLGMVLIVAIASVVALLQNRLFAEMASMFPDKPGGIAMYANEAWKRRFSPLGVIASYGYWAGWAFGMGVFALAFGSLIQAEIFAGSNWSIPVGSADVGLGHVIGLGVLALSTILNSLGVELTIGLNKILGGVALLMIAVVVIGPFLTGDFDASGLTYGLNADGLEWGGLKLAMVFLFLFGWTVYGTEICASIAPEYKDEKRDANRALIFSALLTLVVAILVPIGLGGTVTDAAIAADPAAAYTTAFDEVLGAASVVVTLILAASMLMILNVASADAGRALYGIARDGMGPRQLAVLNRRHQPARAIIVGSVVNAALLLFVGNVLGIIFAANIGYIAAILLSLIGYLMLRRSNPNPERAIRLGGAWSGVAAVLVIYTAALLVVGFLNPDLGGYGGRTEQIVGLAVLLLSLLLWAYRRVVQDKRSLSLATGDEEVPGPSTTITPTLP